MSSNNVSYRICTMDDFDDLCALNESHDTVNRCPKPIYYDSLYKMWMKNYYLNANQPNFIAFGGFIENELVVNTCVNASLFADSYVNDHYRTKTNKLKYVEVSLGLKNFVMGNMKRMFGFTKERAVYEKRMNEQAMSYRLRHSYSNGFKRIILEEIPAGEYPKNTVLAPLEYMFPFSKDMVVTEDSITQS